MANLLDTDFGSESEDDNFNPAPAFGSDDEAAEDSDTEETARPKTNGANGTHTRQPSSLGPDNHGSKDPQNINAAGQNLDRAQGPEEEDDEDGVADGVEDAIEDALDGGDDDEDEDDEDEDEEDAVTVSSTSLVPL